MQTDSSAKRTGRESASAVEWAITVRIPISRHARMTRSAISPRLAMRILWNISRGSAQRLHQEERLPELDGLAVLDDDLGDASRHLGLDFVYQLHRLDDADDLPLLDHVALGHERWGVGLGGAVERADHRRLHREQMRGGLHALRGGLLERGRDRGSGLDAGPGGGRRVLPDDADPGARTLHLELGQVVAHRKLDHLLDAEGRGIRGTTGRSPPGHANPPPPRGRGTRRCAYRPSPRRLR